MGKRLGLSLGSGSIGWAVLQTHEGRPTDILRAGVRIFSDGRDPRTGDPLALKRRRARKDRVRRDRLIRRKSDLRKFLIRIKLFPPDKHHQEKLKSLDPYELRSRAVNGILTPHELGRVLIHLSQRRGFQSNRKASQSDDAEANEDRVALDNALKKSGLTLGQHLQQRIEEGLGTRTRPGEGLTTLRAHYKQEFARIRETQKRHHSLAEGDWDRIGQILFFQRDLKPQQRGYCRIYFADKEERAWRAMPSFQRFRIEQNLLNLRITAPGRTAIELTPAQRARLREKLLSQKTMGFAKLRTLLGLDESYSFNLETDGRDELRGDCTGALMTRKGYFGKAWLGLDLKKQDAIVRRLLEEANPDALKAAALDEWGLTEQQAQALVDLSDANLEGGTSAFSTRALYELIPLLSEQGLSVTEATAKISEAQSRGGRRNDAAPRLAQPTLEYYGAIIPDSVTPQPRATTEQERIYGKVSNPAIHIALNQLRKLVNEIITEEGLPDEITTALSLDLKLSHDARRNLARYKKTDQELRAEAAACINDHGLAVDDGNILRYKLWKELNPTDINDRNSPYSGRNISIGLLFSDEIATGHILPLSRTLDDTYNNKTLCFADEKQMKGNFSPHEACLHKVWPFDPDEIRHRASRLPRRKRYRFEPDVIERWEYGAGGFIAKQLAEREYLSKAVRRYLESLYSDDGEIHARAIPGRLTAKIRTQWDLDSILSPDGSDEENPNDHRRHAIDAVIIGCTDQVLLQRAAAMAAQSQELEFPSPFATAEEFRGRVQDRVDTLVVSHRPDHGHQGALHEATNYGIIENPDDYETAGGYNLVCRRPFVPLFAGLAPDKACAKTAEIRDARLRRPLIKLLQGASSEQDVARIVEAFAREKKIHAIRLLKKEATIIPIEHPSSGKKFRKFVVPGKIHNVAFWQMPSGEIKAIGRSVFEVNQARGDMNRLKPHPAAKLKMTLHKKDMVRVVKSGQAITCIVVSLGPGTGTLKLRPHDLAESGEFKISFGQVRNYQLRKVSMTASGRIHDPGPIF
jgi:CRISPR-associated endonuclease Csn1